MSPINAYAKGGRNQRRAKRYYESEGYEVEIVRYSKWAKNKDYFGLWDLIVVGEHDIRFVQVKTNAKPNKEWMEKAEKWGPKKSWCIKEYIVYRDYWKGDSPTVRVTFSPTGF